MSYGRLYIYDHTWKIHSLFICMHRSAQTAPSLIWSDPGKDDFSDTLDKVSTFFSHSTIDFSCVLLQQYSLKPLGQTMLCSVHTVNLVEAQSNWAILASLFDQHPFKGCNYRNAGQYRSIRDGSAWVCLRFWGRHRQRIQKDYKEQTCIFILCMSFNKWESFWFLFTFMFFFPCGWSKEVCARGCENNELFPAKRGSVFQ